MREARRIAGARVPLFDRLADDRRAGEDDDDASSRVLDPAGLRASVRRELERLLATRCPCDAEALERRPRTTLEYGVPDFLHLHTASVSARDEVARAVQAAVEAYEPRLRRVRVTVEPSPQESERRLRVRVDALLMVGEVAEPVSFVRMEVGG